MTNCVLCKIALKLKRNLRKLFCSPYVRLFSSVFLLWITSLNCSKMLSTALIFSVKQSFRSSQFGAGRKLKIEKTNSCCSMISNTWVDSKIWNTLQVQWFGLTEENVQSFWLHYVRLTNTFYGAYNSVLCCVWIQMNDFNEALCAPY